MANHSKKFSLVRTYYKGGFWNKHQVENAVKKSWITADEYEEITGEAYPVRPEEEIAKESAPVSEVPQPVVTVEVEQPAEDVSEEEAPDSEK